MLTEAIEAAAVLLVTCWLTLGAGRPHGPRGLQWLRDRQLRRAVARRIEVRPACGPAIKDQRS